MPGTINDFMDLMRHFGDGDPLKDSDIKEYHERFVSRKDPDFDYDTYHRSVKESLGKLRDDEFQQEARYAVSQVAPADRQELQGLLDTLLKGLGTATGGGVADVAKKIGLGSPDSSQMSADDAARLMNYARTEHPEILAKIVEEKRRFLKELFDPVVVDALVITAERRKP